MLKYENLAKIGDTIRSFDFAGCKDSYIEGKVINIDDDRGYKYYAVKVAKDTLANREGEIVCVPMEVSILEYDGRLVKL